MKTYLITGGAGFFGTILKKYLLSKGHQVISIDLVHDDFKNKNFNFFQSDIFNIGSDKVENFNTVYQYVINEGKSQSKIVHLPKNICHLGMKICYWLIKRIS